VTNERRIDRVLDPDYLADVDRQSDDELREMRDECIEIETELSYVRRLAQGRIDILEAESERRATGGSIADLVARLPEILADDGPRPSPENSRLPQHLAPAPNIEWKRGLESLLTDASLTQLPGLSDEALADTIASLQELEQDYSSLRRQMHGVLDRIEAALTARLRS
jgi:hypothetical protein